LAQEKLGALPPADRLAKYRFEQGIRIPVQDVEVRSPDVYERLMEVGT
jgi:cytoplasmic iron level regulating protein YaaA (DUF328/UPF0246 family)